MYFLLLLGSNRGLSLGLGGIWSTFISAPAVRKGLITEQNTSCSWARNQVVEDLTLRVCSSRRHRCKRQLCGHRTGMT